MAMAMPGMATATAGMAAIVAAAPYGAITAASAAAGKSM
jgi:hypothetical protein